MNHRFSRTMFLGLILVLVFTLTQGVEVALSSSDCDPDYVTMAGTEITVSPTGVDDTANLQCAFDTAVATGPGTNVRLVSGIYHTAQIVVYGFSGQFTGAGADETEIFNLPTLYVTPINHELSPPSAENPWPMLFTFWDGNFLISDLAIHIVGEAPTTVWAFLGSDPVFTILHAVVGIGGTETHAEVSHVLVSGEATDDWPYGYNSINGIFYVGIGGSLPWLPISGSYNLHHSTFRSIASGSPVMNLDGATVVVSQNEYEDAIWGMEAVDFVNSSLEFSHNNVTAVVGLQSYNWGILEDTGSTFVINNNLLRGEYGIAIDQTFGEGNQCLILGNNARHTTEIGILLGSGIHGCTVVGGGNKTNVLDLGTDNVLVGVNNMGTGVGPTISHFMQR